MSHKKLNIALLFILIILLLVYIPLSWANARFDDFTIQFPKIEKFNDYDVITLNSRTIPKLSKKNPSHQFGEDVIVKDQFFIYPGSGYITELIPQVINSPSHEIFHHAQMVNILGGNDLICPQYREYIFASGDELSPFIAPEGYGIPFNFPVNIYYLFTHFRNDLNETYFDVNLEYKIKISKEKLKPLKIIHIDAAPNPCDKFSSFPISPNTKQEITLSKPFISPYNGKIVLANVHFHDYAKDMKILVNNKEVLNFQPVFHKETDGSHSDIEIDKIPAIYPKNLPIKKGDKINLKTVYDNPTNKPIEAMAIAYFFLAEE